MQILNRVHAACVKACTEVHLFTANVMSVIEPYKRLRCPGLEIRGTWDIICLDLTSHAGSL